MYGNPGATAPGIFSKSVKHCEKTLFPDPFIMPVGSFLNITDGEEEVLPPGSVGK
ncbi:MAG TPA: hypothetical protein VIM77_07660 [Mucilaginibacter sp.]